MSNTPWIRKLYEERNLDYFTNIAFGTGPSGHTAFAVYGNNPDIDAGPEDVWSGGGAYPWMANDTNTSLEILSSSAQDDAGGTGVRYVTIYGLRNYEECVQTVELNGTGVVAVPIALNRINLVLCTGVPGSTGTNVGDVTIRDAGGGTTRAIVPAGHGASKQAVFTVPANHSMLIASIVASINRPTTARDALISLWIRPYNEPYRQRLEYSVSSTPTQLVFDPGLIMLEKTDIAIRITYVSTSNTEMEAGFSCIIRNNDAEV